MHSDEDLYRKVREMLQREDGIEAVVQTTRESTNFFITANDDDEEQDSFDEQQPTPLPSSQDEQLQAIPKLNLGHLQSTPAISSEGINEDQYHTPRPPTTATIKKVLDSSM